MSTITQDPIAPPRSGRTALRLTCLFGGLAGGGAGLALLFTNPVAEGEGAALTQALADSAGLLQGLTLLGMYAAAALVPAAVVLGRRIGGVAGSVAVASGVGVALLLVAYLASFGAGAIVSSMLLESPGPGVGEAMLVTANVTDMARFAPSLALLVAAFVGRAQLPKAVWISAAVLGLAIILPFTAWAAAIVVPLWLGVAGAVAAR